MSDAVGNVSPRSFLELLVCERFRLPSVLKALTACATHAITAFSFLRLENLFTSMSKLCVGIPEIGHMTSLWMPLCLPTVFVAMLLVNVGVDGIGMARSAGLALQV